MKKIIFLLSFVMLNLFQHPDLKAQCTAVSIITQPQNQNDSIPGHAHFNFTVSGTAPFSYYWYVNGVVVDSTINSASANNTYNTPSLAMADSNNTYYCVITNCSGLNSVTSNTVHLLCIPVSISIQPLSQTFTAGNIGTISFSVTVNGTPPFTYRWYRNPNTLVKTTIDTVGHTSIYTFYANPVTFSMNGSYHVVISNYCNGGGGGGGGMNTVVSANAVLTVGCPAMAAPVATSSVGNNGVCEGNIVTLYTQTVNGATYNWTGGYSSSLQNPSFIVGGAQPFCSLTVPYHVTVTLNGCTSPPGTTSFTLYSQPTIIANYSSTICSGGVVSYSPAQPLTSCPLVGVNNFTTYPSCIHVSSYYYNWPIYDTLTNVGTTPCTVNYVLYAHNLSGCGMVSQTNFSVTVNPTPIIIVNSPTICAGQTATLTASGGTSYTWSAGATSTGVNTATVSPTTTTTYTVTGTNSYGCSKTAIATVTVSNTNPVISVNSPSICIGQTATLSANGATSYTWSAGANFTGVNTASASPTITTSYTVTGTNTCGSATAVATVTVNQIPAMPSISGTWDACSNVGIGLTTNPVAGATYNWNDNGYIYPSSSPSYSTNGFLVGTCPHVNNFSLTITVNGCTSPVAYSQTYLWEPPTLNNPPTNLTICSGGTVSYSPSVFCGYADITHSTTSCITGFSNGFANINDVLINNSTVPCTVTYYIHVINDGCYSTYPQYSFTVTVNPAPTITVNSPTICSGQTATLTANEATSYTWSGGATSTGTNTAEASPVITTTYTVTGTNACGTDSTFSTVTVIPTITPSVSISMTSGTNPQCAGLPATFTVTPINGGTLPVYQWLINGVNAGGNSTTFSTSSLSNNDIISCLMTSNEICASSATVMSDSITINSYPVYTTTINDSICAGQTYNWYGGHATTAGTYTASATTINGCDSTLILNLSINNVNTTVAVSGDTLTANLSGATYQWLDCETNNIPIPGATNQSYIVTANGQYAVAVNSGGCVDTSACVLFYSVGISETSFDISITIFPNPFTNSTTITLSSSIANQQSTITITDVLGKEIKTLHFTGKECVIEKGDMEKGIYFVQITDENKNIINRKIIIQ